MNFSEKLEQESDRSAFLIIGAMLEGSLENLILAKLKQGTKFRNIGAGNFYSKIELAYALGLIEEDKKDLYHAFRNARNDFAHSTEFLSFENIDINAVFKSNLSFSQAIDTAIKTGLCESGASDDFFDRYWTPRRKFNAMFQCELEILSTAVESTSRIE